jgi:hypothetical protein
MNALISKRLLGLAVLCLALLGAATPARAQVIFFENFEAGFGAWSADNGVWEVGTPSVVGPTYCFSGSKCAGTNLSGNYPVNTNTRLISPSIILPSVAVGESIYVRFREWHQYAEGDWEDDRGLVQVSAYDPGSQTWSSYEDVAAPERSSSPVWSRKGADLTPYAGKKIRLGFLHIDEFGAWGHVGPGWYVDDVEVVHKMSQFSGGFESGWDDWFTDNGVWEVGTPTSGPLGCHTGNSCVGTILDGDYPLNNNSRLIFPDVELPTVSGLDEIHLRFWQWHQYAEGDWEDDRGQVQISIYDRGA